MSSSTRAPGELSWLMHTMVLAGRQSPKYSFMVLCMPSPSRMSVRYFVTFTTSLPCGADAVEDRLDGVHGIARLLLDGVRMHVLLVAMRMIVVERRRRGAGNEHEVAGADDPHRRRVWHAVRLLRLGMNGLEGECRAGVGWLVHGGSLGRHDRNARHPNMVRPRSHPPAMPENRKDRATPARAPSGHAAVPAPARRQPATDCVSGSWKERSLR